MTENSIYIECNSGISGDMLLAALLDSMPDYSVELFESSMKKMDIPHLSIRASREERFHIGCLHLLMEYGEQPLRHIGDLERIIESSGFSAWVREKSRDVLYKLGTAEAQVHQVPLEHIHFHEIGAADTLIDIVGTFFLLERMGKPRCFGSPVNVGSGTVRTEHGLLPVPAPATALLLKDIPIFAKGDPVELTTPTGAALLGEICSEFCPMPSMRVKSIGYGAGSRKLSELPNILRVFHGSSEKSDAEVILKMECTIDDMDPENYSYTMEQLFENGALDVTMMPVIMKKNRPGIILSVLLSPEGRENIESIMFRETTTAGIRWSSLNRRTLKRDIRTVTVRDAKIRVKILYLDDKVHRLHPEFEDCREIAKKLNVPLRIIQEEVLFEASKSIE